MTVSGLVERNLEAIRRYIPERPGEEWLELLPQLYDPDCDYYPARAGPEAGARHGVDETAAYLREWWSAWEDLRFEIVEITPVDEARALAHIQISAQGFSSGVDLAGDLFICFWLRNGRFLRVEDHMTERGARRALGLPEETE
jgi:hypothetical protein